MRLLTRSTNAVLVLALVTLISPMCSARVIYVKTTGDDTKDGLSWANAKKAVGAGITAATSGDEIWVAAGTYVEGITLKAGTGLYGGFAGTETSRDQRNRKVNATILDANRAGNVVTPPSGVTATTVVDGFTIRNGDYGIRCTGSSPTVSNNIVTCNRFAGISCSSCASAITGNTIVGNGGPGIYANSASPVITNNTVTGNGDSGVACQSSSSPTIANNVISANCGASGGGITCYFSSSPTITNNTITGNSTTGTTPGGICCDSTSSPKIANNIVAFNSSGIAKYSGTGAPVLKNNCVFGNTGFDYSGLTAGIGDIAADPKFVAVQYGRVRIQPDSPCRDAGDDTAVGTGWLDIDGQARIQGTRVDIGADESDGTTWTFTPAVVRVKPSGDDANDGSTWSLAKKTVQLAAIAASAAGGEVWVATGIYTENIVLPAYTGLYGGFSGTETQRDQRNWSANLTILDGNRAGPVVKIFGGHRIAFSAVDGFTICNGITQSTGRGGGIYCTAASPTIANNTITRNSGDANSSHGGGIYCSYSSARIEGNTIVHNYARSGGGITCSYSSPTIANNSIKGNDSSWGGGIECDNSSATIANNTISANRGTYGGGIYGYGANPTIRNNVITGNSAQDGGGISIASATIINNTIASNSAHHGGGVSTNSTAPVAISNNIIAFNSSGIYKSSGTVAAVLRNNCVHHPDGANYDGLAPGTTDLSMDPKLAAIEQGQMHIQPGSPCRDAGDDTVVGAGWLDMDGQARIQGAHVDIGADESDGTAWPAPPPFIVRVSPTGNDANDGSTWALAKKTVQAGADAASLVGGEVWVATGIYTENITLPSYAYLYGGFAGTETERDQRDWNAHPTVLDGNNANRVVSARGGQRVSRIDGFIIRNGKASNGGGISCVYASPIIANNVIIGNSASNNTGYGGGVYCSGSSSIIVNNSILGNSACYVGGGVFCDSASSLAITNNTIIGNQAKSGGGIGFTGFPAISNNVIAYNSSGVHRDGAGTATLSSNCIYNPAGVNYSGVSVGTGDISADPMIADVEHGQVHLRPGSPCIDAGNDSVVSVGWLDMDGQARIQGAHVDIGADESDGTAQDFSPTVIHVSPTGNDANDGLTWGLAKRTVQAGANAAAVLRGEVWVATGTYAENITLPAYAYLYGGFAGTEASRDQRNWRDHASVLDGGNAACVVQAFAGYLASGISGFTIRNGKSPASGSGGGGGAISCVSCSPIIANNAITGNTVSSTCGAIYCSTYASPAIMDNVVAGNTGNAIYCDTSSPTVASNTVTRNSSAAIALIYSCSPTIVNNLLAYNAGGVTTISGTGTPVLRNNCLYNPGGTNYSGVSAGTGDISADPRLVAVRYGQDHIQPGSPCRDAGDDSAVSSGWLDMDGQTRIQGSHVDIGADESNGTDWTATPVVVRVSTTGDDANDGSSWLLAKRRVKAAVDAASVTGGEVWVAAGTYTENVILPAYVGLYGGFSGGETTRDQRDWRANVTVLDGGGAGDVVQSLLGQLGNSIDGFTIRNGGGTNGNGIYCYGSSTTIANNMIIGNAASGISSGISAVTITNNTITGNASSGISCGAYSVTISNNTITGNGGSANGGGIRCSNSPATITGNVITGNHTTNGKGGGIYCSGTPPTITNNTISGNSADTSGGNAGGGIYCDSSSAVITNNLIRGNAGGAIACSSSSATISNNIISGNSAKYASCGILCSSSSPVITNNTITGNNASSNGGGIYLAASSSPTITNNIVAFNSSGIYKDNTTSYPILKTNCVYGNGGYDYSGITSKPSDISVDPKLVAVGYGQVHIQPGSPCIDAGYDGAVVSGWLDMDGQARIQGAHVDIGADESDGTAYTYSPTVTRVRSAGNDANDGSTWELAKKTVQAGVDAASSTGGDVWVAAGTYVENIGLPAYVYLYGGFAGDEDSRSQRDWKANASILDGNSAGIAIEARTGYNASCIDGFAVRNSYRQYYSSGVVCNSASPVVTRNTITGNRGSGVYCISSSSKVTDNNITMNSGSGVFAESSSPIITDNRITGNSVGVYCYQSPSTIITNNMISGGSSDGIYCDWSSPLVSNNTISLNTGYGIYCKYQSSPTIVDNIISTNKACGISLNDRCSPAVTNNTIFGNTAASGGGIYISASSSPSLTNNIIAFNGSGICKYDTTCVPVLKNNCVYGNTGYDYSGLSAGVGDISADPKLVAPECGQLHIQPDSPCRDTGLDSAVGIGWVDMDGQTRIQGAHVDIGVDESDGTSWTYVPIVIRVSPTGNDANDGSSWALAKKTVQAAVDAAFPVLGEVWVAAGTYAEHVTLPAYARLYGGFAGIETARAERNPATNLTVLDGSRTGIVVRALSWHKASELSGFAIRNGVNGINCESSALAITNNTIVQNSADGVSCSTSSPTIANNTIAGNGRDGVHCYTSGPNITNNTICGNSSAGIGYAYYGAITIVNNIIASNGTGVGGSGSTVVLKGNCVYGNSSGNYINVLPGAGDISADPRLCRGQNGQIHIQPGSPCIDAGDDTAVQPGWSDIDWQPRIQGAHVDIGADESDGTTWANTYGIVHVSPDGNDANDGSTWSLATKTVQAAIKKAWPGDEVWVAAGTYVECITSRALVSLFGGFTGTETSRDQRNWLEHETILDGNKAGTVVVLPAGATTLDGFTIRNGKASSNGGGILCASSSPVIANNVIVSNSAAASGGGIYAGFSSNPSVRNNTLRANVAGTSGGGVYCDTASSVSGNVISGNAGGGLHVSNSATMTISGNSITGNTSANNGGGIYCGPGSATILGNTLSANTSSVSGGGIYCDSFTGVIANNAIKGNTASVSGGGIRCAGSAFSIINNTIFGNIIVGGTASAGGGVYFYGSSATLCNNIVAFNSSGLSSTYGYTSLLKCNCVYNPAGLNYANLSAGVSDISVDPRFASPEYGGVHLQLGSPCVDTGDDMSVQSGWTDVDGQARVQGTHVDIGADEYDGTDWVVTPTIVHVGPSGNDANDGSTWLLAKRTVQAGVNAASAAGGEVWVAAGTYTENVTLPAYAYMYGGFAGTETSREQRNWRANTTVLDGGNAGSVVRITAVQPTTVNGIDGFTLRNGNATNGGGICVTSTSPFIEHNTITGCRATLGGGIYCVSVAPKINANTVIANTATSDGGGIYDGNSSSTITNNVFRSNAAARGGGLFVYSAGTLVLNNTLVENQAANYGGGIYCNNCAAWIRNNIIGFNTRGGLHVYVATGGPSPTVSNNCVYGNTIYNYQGITKPSSDISLDPKFANKTGGDYHLQASSPCIDRAIPTKAPAADYDGALRPQDGNIDGTAYHDIGAYEYPFILSAAKRKLADNAGFAMIGGAVTAVLGGSCYVESPDRCAGIRVDTSQSLSEGQVVNVLGSIRTDAQTGERYVSATLGYPQQLGRTLNLRPLILCNRDLAGGPLGLQGGAWTKIRQKDVNGDWQSVWVESVVLNNIGLLVTVFGKVTYAGDDFFYLDDGSALDDASGHTGVKVSATGLSLPVTGHAKLTGIVSCEKSADGKVVPMLKVRKQADIVPY